LTEAHEYDFFVCHASEDKDAFIRPLAARLRAKGFIEGAVALAEEEAAQEEQQDV